MAFIERQGWIYSKEHTEEAIKRAERGFKAEVKEKLRPETPDEKLRRKYARKGIVIAGAFRDTDPDPETYMAETAAKEPSSMFSDGLSEEVRTDENGRADTENNEATEEKDNAWVDTEDDGSWWD